MSVPDDSLGLTFGEPIAGRDYRLRPGSYGVIRDDAGRLAVVLTAEGCFLPGGGAEGSESGEETLVREVREECGLEIEIVRELGTADQLVHAPSESTGYRKRCTFYLARVREAGQALEPGHELLWLPPERARERLTEASQVWALTRAL